MVYLRKYSDKTLLLWVSLLVLSGCAATNRPVTAVGWEDSVLCEPGSGSGIDAFVIKDIAKQCPPKSRIPN